MKRKLRRTSEISDGAQFQHVVQFYRDWAENDKSWATKPNKRCGFCGFCMVGLIRGDGGKWTDVSRHARVIAKKLVIWLMGRRFSVMGHDSTDENAQAAADQQRLTVHCFSVPRVE